MSRPRPGSPRARLFVALDLSDGARSALAAWRDRAVAGRDDLRTVAAGALHVTLCFLGWTPERQVDAIAESVAAACGGRAAATLGPRRVVAVPERRPRLFALDLADDEGRAADVQRRVSEALAAARVYEPEARPFWPHVTLARVKRGARAAPLHAPPPADPLPADEVTLYRSTLRPQGARYDPLVSIRLETG